MAKSPVRLNPFLAVTIYEALCESYNVSDTMRRIGATPAAFWHWCGESVTQKGEYERGEIIESKFYVAGFNPERPEEQMWFHEACGVRAKKIAALNADARARAALAPQVMRDASGNVVYEVDHLLIAQCEGDMSFARDVLLIKDPPYLHTPEGARIPVLADTMAATRFIHTMRATAGHLGWNPEDKKAVAAKIEGAVMFTKPPQIGGPTPMRLSLEQKLAEIREKGPKHPRPQAPVQVFGRPVPTDPPADTPTQHGDAPAPQPAPAPAPKPEPPKPNYARPAPRDPQHGVPAPRADHAGIGRGEVLPGGFKVR